MTWGIGIVVLLQCFASAAQTPRELEQLIRAHDEKAMEQLNQADAARVAAVNDIQIVQREIRDGLKGIPDVVTEMRKLREAMEHSSSDLRTEQLQALLDIAFKGASLLVGLGYALAKGIPAGRRALNGHKNQQ